MSDKIRLLLFNLQLLDVVAGIVGLDEDGYGEHVASAVQIADSVLSRSCTLSQNSAGYSS